MHRDAAPIQSTAAQLFIGLIILVLVAFVALTWDILGKIDEERAVSRRFYDQWLECRSDAVAFLAGVSDCGRQSLLEEFQACDLLYGRIGTGAHIVAARLLQGAGMIDLGPSWARLRDSIGQIAEAGMPGPALAEAGRETAPRFSAFMREATGFERAFRLRLALIDAVERSQRKALLTLQLSAILALLALVALSAWVSMVAHRAQGEGKRLAELVGATFAAQEAERRRISSISTTRSPRRCRPP